MIDINLVKIFYRRLRTKLKEDGLSRLVQELVFTSWHLFWYPVFKQVRGRRSIDFEGFQLRYYCHWYNLTYTNERAVELAIFSRLVRSMRPDDVLEVGAVLPQYMDCSHLVIDKFEQNERFLNIDIVDYQPTKRFSLIVSISTLEHIGYDEDPKDTGKILKALNVIKECLDDRGLFIASIPVGYNPKLDLLINKDQFFNEVFYFRRINKRNDWAVTDKETALSSRFGHPYPFGNAVVVCALGNLNILYKSLKHQNV